MLIGWLFWAYRSFETIFQSISGRLPERRRKKTEMIDERKNVHTTPPAPTASAVGPCPTLIQISRAHRHWKFTQHHRTTRPPPYNVKKGVSAPYLSKKWINFDQPLGHIYGKGIRTENLKVKQGLIILENGLSAPYFLKKWMDLTK